MHRSGTSATAGLLIGLGLAGPRTDDLVPADDTNQRGHWESQGVVLCNSHILVAQGGTGYAPPCVAVGWENDPAMGPARAEAARWFESAFRGRALVLKDPRLCLTLPLWRSALPVRLGAILVLRDPMEVAGSLQARDGLPITLTLAMWERYLRSAAVALEGLPTLVLEYAAMLDDPVKSTTTIADFLADLGVKTTEPPDRAAAHLDPALRHYRQAPAGYEPLVEDLGELYGALAARSGGHEAWRAPVLHAEPAWVEDVLSVRRDYASVVRELYWMKESRVYRLASKVWGLRGGAPAPINRPSFRPDEIPL
jgi:hypothetical protein